MDTMMVRAALSGRRRRRSFSEELKRRMVGECAESGASVSAVARKHVSGAPPPFFPIGSDYVLLSVHEASSGRYGRN